MIESSASRPLVTIIAPACDEAGNAASFVDFFRRIGATYTYLDFELVLVDDGSVDGTADLVIEALGVGDVARIVRLSRNFGSHAAISAGLALARGDCALTVGTDLQEPLAAIGAFLAEWRAGADVVWGIRRTRAVPRGAGNVLSRLFSRLFHRLSEIPTYPKEGPAQVLISRPVIDVINTMPERNRNVFGIIAWVGFDQATVEFDQLPRPAGASKWTTARKIRLLIDSFVEFAPAPFLITMLAGVALTGLGLLGAAALLLTDTGIGWAMVLAAVFFVGGLQLTAIGGFGEYLWRAGDDARNRPLYVLRGVQDWGSRSAEPAPETMRRSAVPAQT
ncbi:MAG TPA: glycosyltransferase family 2 protein [Pseudonocardiaceae bacterium]|nr:glycosyltransferase family 2 protein [Pseudonocardiaceae bacterium]